MGAAERTLSQLELNRALLARQLLLERAHTGLPSALEQVAALQAQCAPSMRIGLWSRVHGFRRDDLTMALHRRTVVQGTLMRATIHLVSAEDYWPFALAVRGVRRKLWLRSGPQRPDAKELTVAAAALRRRLYQAPLRANEIDQLVGKTSETAWACG